MADFGVETPWQAAGMHAIAVSTPLTQESLHQAGLFPAEQIVDDPSNLARVVEHVISQHAAKR